MNVLHVMSDLPFPPDNGARADIWARLLAMSRLGYRVHALVIAQKRRPSERQLDEMRRLVCNLEFVERRPLRKCLATLTPTCISRSSGLAEFQLTGHYDVTLMESEEAVPICGNPFLNTKLRVLRIHNDEVAYLRELAKAEERLLKKYFLHLESLRMSRFSKSVHRRVDSLWFISQTECQRFIANNPACAAQAAWLPPSILLGDRPKRHPLNCKRVLFVGNFYIPLNREGLRWYLRQVHPLLARDPAYELVIAGSTLGRRDAHLFADEIKREERSTVYVDIEDTTQLYENCAVFINPMRAGAGVKLKSIHAIERGIPVVSTPVGNEGSGFADKEHVRLADTPTEFADAVAELLNNQRFGNQMAARAYEHLTSCYNSESNIHRLIARLVSLHSQCPIDHPRVLTA
jgi:glycosyltransferase involved in cell wall biosynthesis